MTLASGSRIGSYEIHQLLGEGGMGQVYQGRDTRLGRDVAIKVLPPSVANDPERLARFEREAKLLASLSHTNIAQIYGLEVGVLVHRPSLALRASARWIRPVARESRRWVPRVAFRRLRRSI